MSLEKQLVDLVKQIHDEKRLGDKRAEQFYNLIDAIEAGDEKVAVDALAVAGYLGAAFNDGVLRTGTPLTLVDGGNFITLGFSHLGIESLIDPNVDKIPIWDDSAGTFVWLTLADELSIDATPTLSVDHDKCTNFVGNKHIDYTSAIDNTNYVVKTPVKAKAYLNNAQDDIANGSWITVDLDAETYDPGNDFNTTTHQYTTPVAGYYAVCGSVYFGDTTANKRYGVGVWNVTDAKWEAISMYVIGGEATTYILICSSISYIAASKALELRAYQNTGGALVDIDPGDPNTSLSIHLLSI